MTPAEHATESLVSTLKREVKAKLTPPIFTFAIGADDVENDTGYVSELVIHNFTELGDLDTEMVILLMRLLTVRASMGLVHRWRDITASCRLPVASSPDGSVLGAKLHFAPLTEVTYQIYTTTYRKKRIDMVDFINVHRVDEASALLRTIVSKINPFEFIEYDDEGLKATLAIIPLPGGGKFMSSGDIEDDITSVAHLVSQHSKLEVLP